jgi:hypothetical protein
LFKNEKKTVNLPTIRKITEKFYSLGFISSKTFNIPNPEKPQISFHVSTLIRYMKKADLSEPAD